MYSHTFINKKSEIRPGAPQVSNTVQCFCSDSMQTAQPNFDQSSFSAQAIPSPPDSSLLDPGRDSRLDRSDSTTQDMSSHEVMEMMELLLIWNSRQFVPELPQSNTPPATYEREFNATPCVSPPRRFHPSVWKAWTRRLEAVEKARTRDEIRTARHSQHNP
jgi:hypothetical protein